MKNLELNLLNKKCNKQVLNNKRDDRHIIMNIYCNKMNNKSTVETLNTSNKRACYSDVELFLNSIDNEI